MNDRIDWWEGTPFKETLSMIRIPTDVRHVFLLNGPPRCGKDTLGALMRQATSTPVYVTKMAKALKERTHALYGLTNWTDRELAPHDAFEDVKDEPSKWFLGLTPRQAYIEVSERYMKALHGQDVWGKILVQDIEDNRADAPIIVVTDSGFAHEAVPVFERYGIQNCTLVRIYRPGCDFTRDSRSYWEDFPELRRVEVVNNRKREDLEQTALRLVREVDVA